MKDFLANSWRAFLSLSFFILFYYHHSFYRNDFSTCSTNFSRMHRHKIGSCYGIKAPIPFHMHYKIILGGHICVLQDITIVVQQLVIKIA